MGHHATEVLTLSSLVCTLGMKLHVMPQQLNLRLTGLF